MQLIISLSIQIHLRKCVAYEMHDNMCFEADYLYYRGLYIFTLKLNVRQCNTNLAKRCMLIPNVRTMLPITARSSFDLSIIQFIDATTILLIHFLERENVSWNE